MLTWFECLRHEKVCSQLTVVAMIACTSKTLPTFEAMWASLVNENGQGSDPAAPASSVEEEQ